MTCVLLNWVKMPTLFKMTLQFTPEPGGELQRPLISSDISQRPLSSRKKLLRHSGANLHYEINFRFMCPIRYIDTKSVLRSIWKCRSLLIMVSIATHGKKSIMNCISCHFRSSNSFFGTNWILSWDYLTPESDSTPKN